MADGGIGAFDRLLGEESPSEDRSEQGARNPRSQAPSAPKSRNRLSSAALRDRLSFTAPWWARVLAIFLVSRLVTTAIMLQFASLQASNAWTGPKPRYLDFAMMWDSHWYFIVAVAGYPSVLPVTGAGQVAENAWAFMPAYPALARGLMAVTGLGFPVIGVFLSVAFALAAALMFYKLMALVLPAPMALFSVVLFCFAPLSPILQVAYAEPMHAFLLTLALYLLVRRDYWMLVPVVAVMSLTRPSGLAFALAMALHVVHRWFTRERDPFAVRERVASVTVALFSALMGFSWLLVAWTVTGSATAYTDTELAWRAPYLGYQELVPFTPWLLGAKFWATQPGGVWVVAGAIVIAVLFVAFMFTPPVRRLGVDIRLWVASYLLYLLAVFFPQSSTFRLLLPIFPLWGAVAQPRSWVYRLSILLLCIAGQIGWVYIAWFVDGYDWTPP